MEIIVEKYILITMNQSSNFSITNISNDNSHAIIQTSKKIYTLSHSKAFLERTLDISFKDSKEHLSDVSMPEILIKPTCIDGLKKGYSIHEFIKILSHQQECGFYTCIITSGRRILWPILPHIHLKQYTIEECITLMNHKRVRVYHIFKQQNIKIKYGYVQFDALSKKECIDLANLLRNDMSIILERACWKYIAKVGNVLWPLNTFRKML